MDVTERVYAPWAADYCRELLAKEDDSELRAWLANALADQCMPQDMEMLAEVAQECKESCVIDELTDKLKILRALFLDDLDANNPELQEIETNKDFEKERSLVIGESHSNAPEDDDEFDDGDEIGTGGETGRADRQHSLTNKLEPIATIRNVVRVSRNSPCPCGSGKKYKTIDYNGKLQLPTRTDRDRISLVH